jgi:hypothetical protein
MRMIAITFATDFISSYRSARGRDVVQRIMVTKAAGARACRSWTVRPYRVEFMRQTY